MVSPQQILSSVGRSPNEEITLATGSSSYQTAPGDGVVCEARRIRSHYLLLDGNRVSRALDLPPPEGRASPYTINAATMQPCRADYPVSPFLNTSDRSRRQHP